MSKYRVKKKSARSMTAGTLERMKDDRLSGIGSSVDRAFRAWVKRRGLPEYDPNYFHHANKPENL